MKQTLGLTDGAGDRTDNSESESIKPHDGESDQPNKQIEADAEKLHSNLLAFRRVSLVEVVVFVSLVAGQLHARDVPITGTQYRTPS